MFGPFTLTTEEVLCMGTLLEALRNLQTIEQELAHVRSRMRTRKNAVSVQEGKIRQLEEDFNALHEQIIEHRKQADSLELDLREREEQVVKLRGGLNAARSNKEYAAILTRMNTLRADNAKIEEQALKAIQNADDLQADSENIQKQIAEQRVRLEDVVANAEQELAKLQTMLGDLSARRTEAAAALPADALAISRRVSSKYDGEAMARVEVHGSKPPYTYVCGGCFMALNPEHANALRIRDEVRTCDNCGRILYMEPGT